jgi:hypothetical protein
VTQPISAQSAPILPTLGSALGGMNTAEQGLAAAASSVAADGPTVDNMVDLVVQPIAFAANAAVVRAADEVGRWTIDLLA